MSQRANDSFNKMNFFVEIEGIQSTAFKKVEGLTSEFGVAEERNGDEPNRKRKQRTVESFENIVLTQGITLDATELEDWHKSGERKSISIVQLNHDREEVRRWNVFEAFPVKYQPFEDMDSMSEDNQVQILEIAHEGFERA